MRPILYIAIQQAKRYRKKHNLPDYNEITDEWIKERKEDNTNRNYDVNLADEKLRKGLNIEKAELSETQGWLISKEANPKDKVIYYIHGGGFCNGSTIQAFKFVSYAVNNFGYDIFSIDYRLTPQYTCAQTIADCYEGYKWLLEKYESENIILMGESAGGNLVFSLCHKLKDEAVKLPAGIVSCSPVLQFLHYPYSYYEFALKKDFGIIFGANDVMKLYRGEYELSHPYISPLLGNLNDFPPVYLDCSNCESLRDEAREMFVLLKEKGSYVEYHELRDFFHAMLVTPQLRYVRKEEYPLIISFINRVFRKEIQ